MSETLFQPQVTVRSLYQTARHLRALAERGSDPGAIRGMNHFADHCEAAAERLLEPAD